MCASLRGRDSLSGTLLPDEEHFQTSQRDLFSPHPTKVFVQKFSGMLEVSSKFCRVLFLLCFSDGLHCPDHLSGHMVAICNDLCIREALFCYRTKVRIHITDKIFHAVPIFESQKIFFKVLLRPILKDIPNLSVLHVCQNRLVLLSAGISFELVDRKNLWKFRTGIGNWLEITKYTCYRDIVTSCDFCSTDKLFQLLDNRCNAASGEPVIPEMNPKS